MECPSYFGPQGSPGFKMAALAVIGDLSLNLCHMRLDKSIKQFYQGRLSTAPKLVELVDMSAGDR